MSADQNGRVKVLVIDDDPALAHMLVMALIERGYLARCVSDPRAALDAVDLHGSQIVLCDIRMPGIDGLELTRRLKSRHGGTQVILMTGYPDQDTVEEAFHLGADDYLIKPFSSLKAVFDAIDRSAQRLKRWEGAMKDVLRSEFPEEFAIIYSSDPYIPSAGDIESMLVQFDGGRQAQ